MIIKRIDDLRAVLEKNEGSAYYNLVGWCSKTAQAIDRTCGSDDIRAEEIRSIGLPACSCSSGSGTRVVADQYLSLLAKYIAEIRSGMV